VEEFLPVVLVGGRSRRFGRDKLVEPVPVASGGAAAAAAPVVTAPERWLVDIPIAALRNVFGPCVTAVGDCDRRVAARADAWIADESPGAGPLGGVITALRRAGPTRAGVFVLAGDMPGADESLVRSVLRAAGASPAAAAVLASAGTDAPVEPCAGVYRLAALPLLLGHMQSGRRSLHDALPATAIAGAAVSPASLRNANKPGDL